MIKIDKKKILALLVTGTLALTHLPYVKAEMQSEGDKVKATKKVNVRTNNGFDGDVIGRVPKGDIVHRILSCDNGWSLIRHNRQIGFVKDEYITDITDENVYCDLDFYEMRKILKTSDNVNMRLDPFIEADAIKTIPKNTRVEVMALTSNNWYLVNYNGILGFVNGEYIKDATAGNIEVVRAHHKVNIRSKASTNSNRYDILYPGDELTFLGDYNKEWYKVDYFGTEAYVMKKFVDQVSYVPVDFMKLVYIKTDTSLLSSASNYANILDYLEKGQTGEVISEEGDFYFIRTFENAGYVPKSTTSVLAGLTVVVDISSQKVVVYDNNKAVLKANVVTGKDSSPTLTGKFKVEARKENYTLYGPPEDYYEVEVARWIQYNNNYGMHDMKMNGNYGGNVYQKDGSHGCVRMNLLPANELYQLVKVGTPVIIHK